MSNLGQYFTTDESLKAKVFEFILNSPARILEPSIGQGDLVVYVKDKIAVEFDMYEIDESIPLLDESLRNRVVYGDFLAQTITPRYSTIIGNPPYVRTKTGNLYIDFISKCINLLADSGELIFIVPSDFLKLTSAANLINEMMEYGHITHIYHPNNEHLFENATIDVIVFRYCKRKPTKHDDRRVLYNGTLKYLNNTNGTITFSILEQRDFECIADKFSAFVGLVSGKESVFKNDDYGNIDVLVGKNKICKYIYLSEYPTDNQQLNEYMYEHKDLLMSRRIRKFNEINWHEWGAPRNISVMNKYYGKPCIYVYNLTRNDRIAFLGKVQYFGGNLIMLLPKKRSYKLIPYINYLNSSEFKKNYTYSGRFKIGHRQLCNAAVRINAEPAC
jgi:adenine-specific DNA-methyltransferase